MIKPLYTLTGVVSPGQKRGKELGFPTANIALIQAIPEGIYAAHVKINDQTYQAATFIGAAKTFNETESKAESYILNFDQDIYGKEITLLLYKKIRENKHFTSVDELITQMNKDVVDIKFFFNKS